MKNLISEHWKIYSERSYDMSCLGRAVVLGLAIFGTSYWEIKDLLDLVSIYLILDLTQYFSASVMYNLLGRLQELKFIEKNNRPTWVNYPAKLCFILKYAVLIKLLLNVGVV